eukprot:4581807-Pleurochrysis_carterae.AAC.3
MLELRQEVGYRRCASTCFVNQSFLARVGIEWPLQPIVERNREEAVAQCLVDVDVVACEDT